MMNNTSAEEAEYTRARTSVWWDIENCPVPKGLDAHGITQTLRSALMKMNYFGPLSISSYGNINLIPNSVQQALSSTGISLNHVPSGRKDASDKKILIDMFLWVVENPAPANLMLISGDGDFSDALHRLRMKRYNILLAHPLHVSASLVSSAKTTWLWRSLLDSDCPRIQCESSGIVDNVLYPSESEISSQVVSEQVLSEQPIDFNKAAGNKLEGTYVPKVSNPVLQQETKRKKRRKKCSGTGESAWFCKICNVACKSFEIFTTHLSDKEHASQLEMKQRLELLGEPENMATTPSESHEMTNNVVETGVKASEHCGLCSVVCPGQNSLDTETIEESVHVSTNCLEKENKELKDTCTASEMSGIEFSQDFKEKMESDGVAPLNVDCIFGQEPKEVRNLKKLEPSENEIVVENLEGILKQGLEIKSDEPENAPAGLTEHLEEDKNKSKKKKKKKKTTVITDEAESYVCKLCSVICDCPAVFESHLKGRKHAAMIKKHTEALLDDEEIIRDNDHPKELIEKLWFQPGESPENIDSLEKQNKKLRERFDPSEKNVDELENGNLDFSIPKEAREWFDSIIKKQELSQDANLTRELEKTNSGDPETRSAAAIEHREEYMDKKRNQVSKDEAEAEAYVCSICNVICDSPIVFESHLMGRRHAARVKKHAEVLFDDKKIIEESLQVLWYQPKEVQQASEQIPSSEFSEPKEAREQLDSIVKRLQTSLSLEDTSSSHKPSEAVNETELVEKRKKSEAAATQIRVCGWCNVTCSSQIDFDSHLTGKKHASSVNKQVALVKKQSETNFMYVRKSGP